MPTINFPDPTMVNKDGLLAIGGSLSSKHLLKAYAQGAFPLVFTKPTNSLVVS